MTSFDLTVDTRELRAALMAVLPHASQDPDLFALCRIRAYVTIDSLVLAATDRFTGAMAKVDIESRDVSAELGCWDLSLQDGKEILALFKPAKDVPHQVRLEHDGKQFQVTDVSGLFPGKSVRFEAFSTWPNFPDLARLIGAAIAAVQPVRLGGTVVTLDQLDAGTFRPRGWRSGYTVTGSAMAKFSAAGRVYGTLSIEPTSALPPALVVTGTEAFAGLLIPGRREVDAEDDFYETRSHWMALAADVSMSHPIPPEVRKERDKEPVIDLSAEFGDELPVDEDQGDDAGDPS